LPIPVIPKGPRVLVAQHALPPGTIITNDAIGFQEWPRNMVADAYFVDGKIDMNKLLGTVVRFPITAGQPLTTGSLVAPGDRGFLAAALAPGMRAITITVSEKSGVAGFVFPGDHVDLMLTTAVKVNAAPSPTGAPADSRDLYATETILKNLRVLATDQSTDQEINNGKTIVHTAHTVTLEATPRIAERIEVAQQGGSLSLVLRSLADNQSDLDHAIANGSVKLKDGATGADEARALAASGPANAAGGSSRATLMGGQIDASPIQRGSTYATAGDVSRFQRRNMPPRAMLPCSPRRVPPQWPVPVTCASPGARTASRSRWAPTARRCPQDRTALAAPWRKAWGRWPIRPPPARPAIEKGSVTHEDPAAPSSAVRRRGRGPCRPGRRRARPPRPSAPGQGARAGGPYRQRLSRARLRRPCHRFGQPAHRAGDAVHRSG
jgi:pilus assembly protein CpaB